MAKGKHALESAQRRETQAVAEKERLEEQLADRGREIVRLKRQLVSQKGVQDEVRRLREQVAAGTSDALTSLQGAHDLLTRDTKKLTDFVKTVRRVHDNAVACALMALGGGAPAMEKFVQILRGPDSPNLILISNEHVSGLDTRAVRLIESKRRNQGNPRRLADTLAKLREMFPGRDYLRDQVKK